MAKLGIQMIEMYTQMVMEKFSPILQELTAHEQECRRKAEAEAEQELGLDILYEKKAELEKALALVKKEIDRLTDAHWENGKRIEAPLPDLVKSKMKGSVTSQIRKQRDELVDRIKLSGVDDETRNVFTDLPDVLAEITTEVAKLTGKTIGELTD